MEAQDFSFFDSKKEARKPDAKNLSYALSGIKLKEAYKRKIHSHETSMQLSKGLVAALYMASNQASPSSRPTSLVCRRGGE